MALNKKKIIDFIEKHADTEELFEIAFVAATEIECKDCPALSFCNRHFDRCYENLGRYMEEE